MPWKRRPVDDLELFAAEERKAKAESRAEEAARLERMAQLQAEAEERRQADDAGRWARMDLKNWERSYRARGVEPPETAPGDYRATLDLLLILGWRVEDGHDGKRILVRPARTPEGDGRGAYRLTTPEPTK